MACCLPESSHHLNQCGLIIGEVLWHSPVGNFTENAQYIYPWHEFENYRLKITGVSLKGQWVNDLHLYICHITFQK